MTKSLCDSCVNKNCRWRAETVSNDPPVMDCTDFKTKITNADKIRAMTDEELATLFTKVMAGNSGLRLDGIWPEKGMEENKRYFTRLNWLDWLKKEAEQ